MNTIATDFLFKELTKNEEDFDFFLHMYHDFHSFYESICKEYCDKVFIPILRELIKKYNEGYHGRNIALFSKDGKEQISKNMIKSPWWFCIRSEIFWPDKLRIDFGGDRSVANKMWIGLRMLEYDSKKINKCDPKEKKLNINDFLDLFRNTLAKKESSNKNDICIYRYYDEPYKDWNTSKNFLKIVAELKNDNKTLNISNNDFPFALHYINDLMNLVKAIDKHFKLI